MPEPSSQPDDGQSTDEPAVNRRCRNCTKPLLGEYCAHCGQRDTTVIRFFPSLILEAFEGLFAFDSKTYRSLWLLFSRPAFLSQEFLAGRRVSYLAPMRLFIIFLLAFLMSISLELFLDSLGIDIAQETEDIEQFDSAEYEATTDLEEFESGMNELLNNLRIPFLSEQSNRQFTALLQERASNNLEAVANDPQDFFNGLLENVPVLVLIMMPLLALLQKLFYIRSGRYYVEHLVLTVHNHSFLFLIFILIFLLDLVIWSDLGILPRIAGFLESLLNLWVVLYLYLSLRVFFNQGYIITAMKFLAISITYGALLTICALVFMLVGFFIY